MNETLIKAENVSKKFCKDLKRSLWFGIKDLGNELLGRSHNENGQLRKDEFWAVNNVSFELKRGECLGLIGRNGAGKTTLLRMLTGLIKPDKGRIEMRGRVGALIALGTGFNPILTGRENVYVNAAVLGLSKKETDVKFEKIVEFAELGKFIDAPVQSYSSGMTVRLGFAVATALEPDILIIDEVLAVGDIGFVLKCFNRIDRLSKNTSVIFVSHNMLQVSKMCTHALLLNSGKPICLTSDVAKAVNVYYSMFKTEIGDFIGSTKAKLKAIALASGGRCAAGNQVLSVNYGKELKIKLEVEIDKTISKPHLYMAFYDKEQRNFAEIYSSNGNFVIENKSGWIEIEATIPSINFSQGIYSITVAISKHKGGQVMFRQQSAIFFQVVGAQHGWAPIQIRPIWRQLNGIIDKTTEVTN
jgi:lipopolysaccharide transport system ATP-binding protein